MNLSIVGIGVSGLAVAGLLLAAGQASRLRTDLRALDERVKAVEGARPAAAVAPKAADPEDPDKFRDEVARLRALLDGMKDVQDRMGGNATPSGLTMLDLRAAVEAALADRERQARAAKAADSARKAAQHNERALDKAAREWKLTPDQTEKVRAILAEQVEGYKAMWTADKGAPDTAQAVNTQAEEKILAVLTDQQKGLFHAKPLAFFLSQQPMKRDGK